MSDPATSFEHERLPGGVIRYRDRWVLRNVAVETATLIVLRAPETDLSPLVDDGRYSPAPPRLTAFARTTMPNCGLMAADPTDPRLIAYIAHRYGGSAYAGYLRDLRAAGFAVSAPESGYVVSDGLGALFYPAYVLLAVIAGPSGRSAWTQQRGEGIRATLNRRIGAELVQWGPLDTFEHRDAIAPMPAHRHSAALFFFPSGAVEREVGAEDIARRFRRLGITWPAGVGAPT